jgi:hypothetical protein
VSTDPPTFRYLSASMSDSRNGLKFKKAMMSFESLRSNAELRVPL